MSDKVERPPLEDMLSDPVRVPGVPQWEEEGMNMVVRYALALEAALTAERERSAKLVGLADIENEREVDWYTESMKLGLEVRPITPEQAYLFGRAQVVLAIACEAAAIIAPKEGADE